MAVVGEKFTNAAQTTTTADPGSGGTTLAVTDGSTFPATGNFRVKVENEIMVCTARTGNSLTVVRGQEGTTGVAHAVGVLVDHVLTAESQRRYVPEYVIQPRHHGLVAWSHDPTMCDTDGQLSAGVLFLSKLFIPETVTLANLLAVVNVIGATLTANQNVGAVYNSAGTKIGDTANQATAWTSLGLKTMALTVVGGQSLTIAGGPDVYVWAALLGNGTTMPRFRASVADAIMGNVGLTTPGATQRFGTVLTAQTSMPTSITPANIVAGRPIWLGCS